MKKNHGFSRSKDLDFNSELAEKSTSTVSCRSTLVDMTIMRHISKLHFIIVTGYISQDYHISIHRNLEISINRNLDFDHAKSSNSVKCRFGYAFRFLVIFVIYARRICFRCQSRIFNLEKLLLPKRKGDRNVYD